MPITEVSCPVCGSLEVFRRVEPRVVSLFGFGSLIVPRAVYTCSVCRESGDFADENDEVYEKAIEELKLLNSN